MAGVNGCASAHSLAQPVLPSQHAHAPRNEARRPSQRSALGGRGVAAPWSAAPCPPLARWRLRGSKRGGCARAEGRGGTRRVCNHYACSQNEKVGLHLPQGRAQRTGCLSTQGCVQLLRSEARAGIAPHVATNAWRQPQRGIRGGSSAHHLFSCAPQAPGVLQQNKLAQPAVCMGRASSRYGEEQQARHISPLPLLRKRHALPVGLPLQPNEIGACGTMPHAPLLQQPIAAIDAVWRHATPTQPLSSQVQGRAQAMRSAGLQCTRALGEVAASSPSSHTRPAPCDGHSQSPLRVQGPDADEHCKGGEGRPCV